MTVALAQIPPSTALISFEDDLDATRSFIENASAESTRRAYRSDWARFTAYCESRGLQALPAAPATVAGFLSSEALLGKKPSTLGRRVAAIRFAHRAAGQEPPTSSELVRQAMKGIRRTMGSAKVQKAPLMAGNIREIMDNMPDTLKGKRDKALLAFGFAGAFRRSELVALTVDDLEFTEDGLRVTIRRSKTDQSGEGQQIAILRGTRLCPVQALRDWLDAAGITSGRIFRSVRKGGKHVGQSLSAEAVALVTKRYVGGIGLDRRAYSAHSLRAGFLTSAAEAGATVWKMCEVSRHKSLQTLQSYVRRVDLFRDHAGSAFL